MVTESKIKRSGEERLGLQPAELSAGMHSLLQGPHDDESLAHSLPGRQEKHWLFDAGTDSDLEQPNLPAMALVQNGSNYRNTHKAVTEAN